MAYQDLEEPLADFLESFGRPKSPHYPYWHLQSDGLWEIPELAARTATMGQTPSQGDLRGTVGGFPKEVAALLAADPDYAQKVAGVLLDDHFPGTAHEELLDAVGMPWTISTRQKRDPAFREEVLRIYEHRCAICGYDGWIGKSVLALEAAHVKWHAAGGPDKLENGLALCSFHHKALDRGALGVGQDNRILVSEHVRGASGVQELLLRFGGHELRPPLEGRPRPAATYLEWHRSQVFRTPARNL